ncbi:type IX secretion system outer membrane channel protein PorV [Flavobacterium zepuense]|uniref:Type IX secretion system outer membrane channel protein PorV n=1 Tax=Flavobacterium zepuense TaxID=2593302 RepID=A0A552V4C6_9FLAO|nr:type IX secretion system outer membrane channel protein PorV [Flavobacterium zepuense]TRW25323.1 type IX secretion system outer membrane channel protein PorV [Flavobacterium zepuense]
MKKIIFIAVGLLGMHVAKAQDNSRVITTGVPFLLIAADARAAGMADQGVATSSDVFSQQWNPAKYAFALKEYGFSASYTPYMTSIANDISLGQVTFFNKFDERMAFAGSLRYFSLGEIELRQNAEDPALVRNPNELAVDLSYSLKLDERFSMSVAARYIRSNLRIAEAFAGSSADAQAASSFAFDLSGFYQSEETAFSDFDGRWRAGFNLQNLGPKISYDSDPELSSNFLPANLKLGGGFDFIFDEYNTVGVSVEFAKLLVPTPPATVAAIDADGDGEIGNAEQDIANNEYGQRLQDYNDINWVSGMFKSFGDAPDGVKEELKEITYSVGAEYTYNNAFMFRLGYFNENELKGARKFFSMGAGFKYNVVKVDVSYLFSASKVRNPLENTLRFSLTFNFGDDWDEY